MTAQRVDIGGYLWRGPYHFGLKKPLGGPAYLLIITSDEVPICVTATNCPKLATEVLPPEITSRYRDFMVCYQDIGQDDDSDVEDRLEFYREKYELD